MGNAVLDILAPVTEEFLKSKNLEKGSMTLVDQEVSDNICSFLINENKIGKNE